MRLLILGISLLGLGGCSYASIETCYDADNTLTATIDGQPFNVECTDAAVGENDDGVSVFGILTTPDPDLLDISENAFGFETHEQEYIRLSIVDPEAGETYTFRGSPNPPSFGDPTPDEGAFITISEVQRIFAAETPATGSVTLDTYTSSRATGTFETTFSGQPVRGQFDVSF